jgi:hypothetical protein
VSCAPSPSRFEGAYPYLALIARSAGIADPLDRRVVEAYWLGSELLRDVPVSAFGASIDERFRDRVRRTDWRWLATKPIDGAKPVHAFHVLDVFPRVGLIRAGQIDGVLQVMDSCRIRWGRVLDRIGDQLVVSATGWNCTRVDCGTARRPSSVSRPGVMRPGSSTCRNPGDVVSIHWSWACDRLDPRQLANLIAWTDRQLAIANQTI